MSLNEKCLSYCTSVLCALDIVLWILYVCYVTDGHIANSNKEIQIQTYIFIHTGLYISTGREGKSGRAVYPDDRYFC